MFRSDLWVAAFVRRRNDLGQICVISRRGDALAGQIFIEVDHLNGEMSLFTPAPLVGREGNPDDRVFECRLDHVAPPEIRARIAREEEFDPDFWLISLEARGSDFGIERVR